MLLQGVTWGALTENPADENFKDSAANRIESCCPTVNSWKDLCLWKPPSVEPVPEEPAEGALSREVVMSGLTSRHMRRFSGCACQP